MKNETAHKIINTIEQKRKIHPDLSHKEIAGMCDIPPHQYYAARRALVVNKQRKKTENKAKRLESSMAVETVKKTPVSKIAESGRVMVITGSASEVWKLLQHGI